MDRDAAAGTLDFLREEANSVKNGLPKNWP